MPTQISEFDSALVLDTSEAIEEYLIDAFESEDATVITHALGVVARARGMSQLAEETGLSRQALYKALNNQGNPEFATIMKVANALGFRLSPTRIAASA